MSSSLQANQGSQNQPLPSQLSHLSSSLAARRQSNAVLRAELTSLTSQGGPAPSNPSSLLILKDSLRGDIASLTTSLLVKTDRLRQLEATMMCLDEENKEKEKMIEEMRLHEDEWDREVEKHAQVAKEYELLRNLVDENEFIRQEQLWMTQMKLEENSQAQMEVQVREIGEKMAADRGLAKEYLEKYVKKLEDELAALS